MEEIRERLRAELESRGYTKPVMAARAAGLENSQGLRDVLAGRKRLSTELLALLSSRCGVDANYVTTGVRRGEEHAAEEIPMTLEQVKAKFRRQGLTVTAWAKANGYSAQSVYQVLNGQSKARWGKGHEIAVKLGLKPNAS